MRCAFLVLPCLVSGVLFAAGDCLRPLGEMGAPGLPGGIRVEAVVPGRARDTIPVRGAASFPLEVALANNADAIGTVANGVFVTHGGYAGLVAITTMPFLRFLPTQKMEDWTPLAGKKVLLLGEGLDDRVSNAARAGVDVRSVDLWYDPRVVEAVKKHIDGFSTVREQRDYQLLVDFYEKHRKHLVAGSALDIPYGDGTFDAVRSQRLLNNLAEADQWKALEEMCRVVAVGGTVQVSPHELYKNNREKLRTQLGDRFQVESDRLIRLR